MEDFAAFLHRSTRIAAAPLCPEIRLRLSDALEALWSSLEEDAERKPSGVPFWAIAWPGGQAIARYLLDHPELVRGRSVLDVGCGCGIGAIAAALGGATTVVAADSDPLALEATRANAALNGVAVTTVGGDLVGSERQWDVVLAGDLWYERFFAMRVTPWLEALAAGGAHVLVGDCGRAYFPRGRMREIARYPVPTPEALERARVTSTAVWEPLISA